MAKFKTGDRVRSVKGGFFGSMPVGTEGVIESIEPNTTTFPYNVNFQYGGKITNWCAGAAEIALVAGRLAPQAAKVLSILRAKGSLTSVEAQAIAKVRSLTRRISDLKEAGFMVLSETRRDTEGQRYVRYYLNEAAAA